MGAGKREMFVSGGFTLSFAAIAFGFARAFPDLIIPFGWSFGVLCAGLLGLFVTVVLTIRIFLWPLQDPRQPYVVGIHEWLTKHFTCERRVKDAATDAGLLDAEEEYKVMVRSCALWLTQYLGAAAGAKYATGVAERREYPWPGEHSPERRNKRGDLIGHLELKMAHLNDLLASAQWDDPVPLRKRQRSKDWKLMSEEFRRLSLPNGDVGEV